MLQVQMRRHWKDKNTLYNILKFEFLTFHKIYCNKHLNIFSLTFFVEYICGIVMSYDTCLDRQKLYVTRKGEMLFNSFALNFKLFVCEQCGNNRFFPILVTVWKSESKQFC